jgi:hypothetical protein
MNHVRWAMREHDRTAEVSDAGMSDGPRPLQTGLTVATRDHEGDERFHPLRLELAVSAFGVNLIRLRPRQRGDPPPRPAGGGSPRARGAADARVECEPCELPKGTLTRVAPHLRRRLTNRGDEPLAVSAIGGAEPHEGRDGLAFASWDDRVGAAPQEIPLPANLDA